jgi:hypothetical protein
MNERIRELAGRALDKVVPYTWTTLDYDEIQKLQEKFAELIVQECIDIALVSSHKKDDMGSIIANNIKKHFGVEE